MHDSPLWKDLTPVLVALDSVDLGIESAFHQSWDKETWETRLSSIVRKERACNYHLDNVRRLIAESRATVSNRLKSPSGSDAHDRIEKRSVVISTDEDGCAFELSAFMAATKSGLDFLAILCCEHIKGVDGDSIKTLLKVAPVKSSPLLDLFRANADWLTAVTEYRHPLVHRLSQRIKSGGVFSELGGVDSKTLFPIVVPQKPPRNQSDTRRSRACFDAMDGLEGLMHLERTGSVTFPDGVTKTIQHDVETQISSGCEPIDDFMIRHLETFRELIVAVVQTIARTAFTVEAPKPRVITPIATGT